jgi:hypothetical protein
LQEVAMKSLRVFSRGGSIENLDLTARPFLETFREMTR